MMSNTRRQMVMYISVVMFVSTVSSQDPQTESPWSHLIKHDGDWYEISYHPGSLYKFSTIKKTFNDAQATCEAEGAHLVSIHSYLDMHMGDVKEYLAPQEHVSLKASKL